MTPQEKRISAARRCPSAVLLTYADALVIASTSESKMAEVARLQVQTKMLQAEVEDLRNRLDNLPPPDLGRSKNGMPRVACRFCRKPCTNRPGVLPCCRDCYLQRVSAK